MPNDLPDWTQNASVPGQTLTLPSGTPIQTTAVTLPNRAAAILLDVLTSGFTSVAVTGVTSAETYLSLASPASGPRAVIVTDFRDAQVNVQLAHAAGISNDTVDVSFMPAAVIAMLAAGALVDVSDRAGRNLGTVALSASPPLWQAPRLYASVELSGTGNTVMVTGVVNQTVRLFGWSMEADQAASVSIGWLEDTVSAAGTVSARLAVFSSPGNSGGSGYEAGKPVTLGQGIRLNVPLLGAGGTLRATIGYSQG